MTIEVLVRLHDQGLSTRQIAARTGRTRNSVIGALWRHRKGGPRKPARVMPTVEEARAALEANGGNLCATGRQLGISTGTLLNWGFHGNELRGPNCAKDFETYMLIEEISASGLSDRFITERVDMGNKTIYRWRSGRLRASPFLAQCVRSVITEDRK